jgi:ABC-2 type transport system ATP-binding protein
MNAGVRAATNADVGRIAGDADVALEVRGLGKSYRRGNAWALRDCSFRLPAGRVAALVGVNGAGKSTLINTVAGLLTPSHGQVMATESTRISLVAQEKPLYRHFSVKDMLTLGARLNRVWDNDRATRWLDRFDIPPNRPCGKLSGGQQAQVAFAIALGSCPSVLLLDEPLANLDPLARREVTQQLLTEVADTGVTVLLSSHVVAELDGVADYLLLLAKGNLVIDGDVDNLLATHLYYVGPRADNPPGPGEIVQARHTDHQSTFLVTLPAEQHQSISPPWTVRPATLEDLVLAHLENGRKPHREAA